MNAIHTAVGHSFDRLDAAEKVTGEAQYVDDLYRPGMLHGVVLGSTHAHARIRGYKLDAARAIPGVAAIVTGEDFQAFRTGAFCKDEAAAGAGKDNLPRRAGGRHCCTRSRNRLARGAGH